MSSRRVVLLSLVALCLLTPAYVMAQRQVGDRTPTAEIDEFPREISLGAAGRRGGEDSTMMGVGASRYRLLVMMIYRMKGLDCPLSVIFCPSFVSSRVSPWAATRPFRLVVRPAPRRTHLRSSSWSRLILRGRGPRHSCAIRKAWRSMDT